MPDLDGIREKKYGPRCRDTHEQDLGKLDNLPAVVSIGDPAEINGKQQKRSPVADIGKTRQNRRVKLLKQQPVTDDVLDVVRHHGQHCANKEEPKVPVMKC